MGQQGLWYTGGTLRRGKMQGDDIIFPNLDMYLITLAGWFNESLKGVSALECRTGG